MSTDDPSNNRRNVMLYDTANRMGRAYIVAIAVLATVSLLIA